MIAAKEKTLAFRPRLVLGHPNPEYVALNCRGFRRLGWEVYRTESGEEVRRLTRQMAPAVVVLATALSDASGWLTCEKLLRDHPDQKVILVAPYVTPILADFTSFVGATALVGETDGVQALVDEVRGMLACSSIR